MAGNQGHNVRKGEQGFQRISLGANRIPTAHANVVDAAFPEYDDETYNSIESTFTRFEQIQRNLAPSFVLNQQPAHYTYTKNEVTEWRQQMVSILGWTRKGVRPANLHKTYFGRTTSEMLREAGLNSADWYVKEYVEACDFVVDSAFMTDRNGSLAHLEEALIRFGETGDEIILAQSSPRYRDTAQNALRGLFGVYRESLGQYQYENTRPLVEHWEALGLNQAEVFANSYQNATESAAHLAFSSPTIENRRNLQSSLTIVRNLHNVVDSIFKVRFPNPS